MVSFALPYLVAFFAALAHLGAVSSVPVSSADFDGLDNVARDILARATPAAPHFVIYSDEYVSGLTGPPPVAEVQVHTL